LILSVSGFNPVLVEQLKFDHFCSSWSCAIWYLIVWYTHTHTRARAWWVMQIHAYLRH